MQKFIFILSLALGKYEHEILRDLTSVQISRYMAYYQLNPWGDYRADLRNGITTATIANIHRNEKEHPEPYYPHDFILFMKRKTENINKKVKSVLSKFKG